MSRRHVHPRVGGSTLRDTGGIHGIGRAIPGKRTLTEALPGPCAGAVIQRKLQSGAAGPTPVGGGDPAQPPALATAGVPLPAAVRGKMERAMGADFSAVRIHQGSHVPALHALGYTQGTDIHFAPGRYDPESRQDQELLGHELAHVVQQAQGRVHATAQAKGVALNTDSSLEREADEMGARVAAAEAGESTRAAGEAPAVHRRAAPAGLPSGAPVQRKPSSGGAGWHDPAIHGGVDLEHLGNSSDGKMQFRISGTNIEFEYNEELDQYYDADGLWTDVSVLTAAVETHQPPARTDAPRDGRASSSGMEDVNNNNCPSTSQHSHWLTNQFTMATREQIWDAVNHALIIYDGMGKDLSEGKRFAEEAEAWRSKYEGVATISFLDLVLDRDPKLTEEIRNCISQHIAHSPLNVVVLGHGQPNSSFPECSARSRVDKGSAWPGGMRRERRSHRARGWRSRCGSGRGPPGAHTGAQAGDRGVHLALEQHAIAGSMELGPR
jgi:hypothetical protein